MMGERQSQHNTVPAFVEQGQQLLNDVIDATDEGREAQRMKNQLNMADLLSKVPALSGAKPNATAAEREIAKYEAFAKIQAGEELGMKPMEALRGFYVGQNGIEPTIHTRLALALRTGRHRFEIIHLNETGASIQWYRKNVQNQWEACAPTTCTRDQMKHTKVWDKGKEIALTDKWNYKSWFEDMAFRFVQIRNIRRYAAETQGSWAVTADLEEALEDAGTREVVSVPTDADVHGEQDDAFTRIVRDTGFVPGGPDPFERKPDIEYDKETGEVIPPEVGVQMTMDTPPVPTDQAGRPV